MTKRKEYVGGFKAPEMGTCEECKNESPTEVVGLAIFTGTDPIEMTVCLKHLNKVLKNLIHNPVGQALIRAQQRSENGRDATPLIDAMK